MKHTNMKFHIRDICENAVLYQLHGHIIASCNKIGIIYIVLTHINMIQALNILHRELIIDDVILGKYQLYTSLF